MPACGVQLYDRFLTGKASDETAAAGAAPAKKAKKEKVPGAGGRNHKPGCQCTWCIPGKVKAAAGSHGAPTLPGGAAFGAFTPPEGMAGPPQLPPFSNSQLPFESFSPNGGDYLQFQEYQRWRQFQQYSLAAPQAPPAPSPAPLRQPSLLGSPQVGPGSLSLQAPSFSGGPELHMEPCPDLSEGLLRQEGGSQPSDSPDIGRAMSTEKLPM